MKGCVISRSFSRNTPGKSAGRLAKDKERAAGRDLHSVRQREPVGIDPALIHSRVVIVEVGRHRAIRLDYYQIICPARIKAASHSCGGITGEEIKVRERDTAQTLKSSRQIVTRLHWRQSHPQL